MIEPLPELNTMGAEHVAVGNIIYPTKLLRAIANGIRAAHQSNPTSWALAKDGSALILLVGNSATTIVSPKSASFISKGTLDPDDASTLDQDKVYTDYPFEAFYLRDLNSTMFATMFEKYYEQHVAGVVYLARKVKTRGNFHHRHQQQSVEQIAEAISETIPAPGYYGAGTPPVSGYWRYIANRESWAEEYHQGYLSSQGWPNPQVDLRELSSEKNEFSKQVSSMPGLGPEAAKRLWNIAYGMETGDHIIAHQGKKITALGIVDGDYEYLPDEPTRMHRRPVRWSEVNESHSYFPKSPAATRAKSDWGTVPLTEQDYLELTGSGAGAGKPKLDLEVHRAIQEGFERKGLSYTAAQTATFYTALQTKGFVVLSGISGTGKSKIAQHFVEMLPNPGRSTATKVIDPDTVISLTVKPYMRKYRRVIIPVKQLDLLPGMEPGTSIEIMLSLGADRGSGRLECRQHSTGNVIRVLYFHGVVGDAIEQLTLDQPLYLSPVYGEDEETLERIDMFTDTAQMPSDIVAVTGSPELRNNLFLPVRPDWRDSTSLLGYYNPLTQTYEWTDFLRFILQAAESYKGEDGIAWFVILDEMNLAHVEYYFADLLSIIESGRREDGFSHDPIRLAYPDTLVDNAPPREIYLPPNLYIIGTVNMDETTHAFSPKVLDRAFTIELTDVDFSAYPPTSAPTGTDLSDDEKKRLLAAFTRNGTFAQISKAEIAVAVDARPQIRTWLSNLMAEDRFHFGYRVFDEVAQLIHNADRNGMFDNWESAFDHAVFMKVLPKFNGSRARLLGPLTTLVAWTINPDAPDPDSVTGHLRSLQTEQATTLPSLVASARFPRVAKRGLQMMIALEEDGFVSFG